MRKFAITSIAAMPLLAGITAAYAVDINQIPGACTRFEMPGRDLTHGCKPVVLNNVHANGRNAFLFASQGQMMSFAGDQANSKFDGVMHTLSVDQVIVNDGLNTRPIQSKGSCKYGIKKAHEAYPITCDVSSPEGRFKAGFIADVVNIEFHHSPDDMALKLPEDRSSFPAKMHGVWASSANLCRGYAARGIRALQEVANADWVEIRGANLRGTETGRFIRVGKRGVVEVTNPSDPDYVREVALTKDGMLDVGTRGFRASALYVRCTTAAF